MTPLGDGAEKKMRDHIPGLGVIGWVAALSLSTLLWLSLIVGVAASLQ